MKTIRVPATSANIGAGFDAIGLAVNVYLTLTIEQPQQDWEVVHDTPHLPHDAQHLCVATALQVAKQYGCTLPPHRISVVSDIPMTRGLGSSSAAIVAGIELANQLADLQLTDTQKMHFAAALEGHPDNVVPAILGGTVLSWWREHQLVWHRVCNTFGLVAVVPSYELATTASREALPEHLPYATAVQASAIANLLSVALVSDRLDLLQQVLESDQFHEPFRQHLVAELSAVRNDEWLRAHSVGSYLSGAGPTVMIVVEPSKQQEVAAHLAKQFPTCAILPLHCESQGVVVSSSE